MPEEIEVETKELQETIDEMREERKEMKEEEGQVSWLRWISLSTAILAVIAAVAALQAGTLSNHSLAKMSDAVMQQARAADEWEQYQSKSIKSVIATQAADTLALNPAQASAVKHWREEAERYKGEQKEIAEKANKYEEKRDEDDHEADELMHHHHIFAYCVTFTQVAIALSAIAALTRRKAMWYLSMMVGVAGAIFFINGFITHHLGTGEREGGHPVNHTPAATVEDAPHALINEAPHELTDKGGEPPAHH